MLVMKPEIFLFYFFVLFHCLNCKQRREENVVDKTQSVSISFAPCTAVPTSQHRALAPGARGVAPFAAVCLAAAAAAAAAAAGAEWGGKGGWKTGMGGSALGPQQPPAAAAAAAAAYAAGGKACGRAA
jgi:hypothetical protein